MGRVKAYYSDLEEQGVDPDDPEYDFPENYRRSAMALGSKNKKGSKKGKGSKKSKSSFRTIGSIWQNRIKTKDGKKKTILNFNVDNPDPKDEYHKGTLIWLDKETGKAFKVKSMNLFEADKGPDDLLNKLSINLENEYQVEEQDTESEEEE